MLAIRDDETTESPDRIIPSVTPAGFCEAVLERLLDARRREVAAKAGPLLQQERAIEGEVGALQDAIREELWKAVVKTRELHGRLSDSVGRLHALRVELRELTGRVRVTPESPCLAELLTLELRRFAVTATNSRGEDWVEMPIESEAAA